MKRRQWAYILAAVALSGALFVFPLLSGVRAQGTYNYNFEVSTDGWEGITVEGDEVVEGYLCNTSYVAGQGWRANGADGATCGDDGISVWSTIHIDLGSPVAISSIQVEASITTEADNTSQLIVRECVGFTASPPRTNTCTDWVTNAGSNQSHTVLTINLGGASVQNVYIQALNNWLSGAGDLGGGSTVTIHKVSINETLTPTNTPTITPTPTLGTGFQVAGSCTFLGSFTASFADLPGKWTLYGDGAGNPPGSTLGLYLPGSGAAELPIVLDPMKKYSIEIRFTQSAEVAGNYLLVSLGQEDPLRVDVAEIGPEIQQRHNIAEANYTPLEADTGLYKFKIERPEAPVESAITVDYACITESASDENAKIGVSAGIQAKASQCGNCSIQTDADLITVVLSVFSWIWCSISQLWDCVAKPIFANIWQGVVSIIAFIAMLRLWAGTIVNNFGLWVGDFIGKLVGWAGGAITNLITTAYNALLVVLAQLGLLDFFYSVLAFIGQLPGLVVGVINALGNFVSGALQAIPAIFNMVLGYITRAYQLVLAVLGVIPIIVLAIIEGFNSTEAIPAWAPSCSTENTLFYYPCLGMYVLDNTIFQGPVYYLLLLIMGFLALNVLFWTIRQITEVLQQ